ncbi:MAG: hypothetical protein ACR2JW_02450 [Thermomicrobiales bacterium]
MQFSATWQDVLAGRKTMTRRIAKPTDTAVMGGQHGDQVEAVRGPKMLRWAVGRTYPVQPGRGKHAIGRIRITAICYCERAGGISEEDSRAEGFESASEFRAVYGRLNGAETLDQPCWALSFVVVDD